MAKLERRSESNVPTLVATLALLCAGCGGPAGARSGASGEPAQIGTSGPPSILLVSLDTTRADRLGCYGRPVARTPEIDRLAREGTVFERAFTPAPITLPAHASLLTGRFPHRHGARDNGIYRLLDDVPTLGEGLRAAGYRTAAVVGAAVLDRHYGLARGFDVYDDEVPRAGLAIAERDAAAVTERALAVAGELSGPAFLFVHYFDPHAAYRPPPRFSDAEPYQGEIAYVDEQIGRLLRGLARLDAWSRRLVVITADHGESLGEHGEATHGVFLYQATLHVPLVVAGPGWPAGRRVKAPASLVDVAPTLLAAAGARAPDGLDGRILTPAEAEAPVLIPLESEFGLNSYGWAPLSGLTDGRLKWIRAPRPELYDLESDPGERTDLAAAQPERAERMAARWREEVREDLRGARPADPGAAEREERLRALGYVAGSRGGAHGSIDALPDPKDVVGTLDAINEARRSIGARSFEAAERTLASVLARSPRNVSALVLLGSARLTAGRHREAVAPLTEARTLAPLNPDVHFNLGLARLGSGEVAAAEAAWRRTLELRPRFAEASANLADVLLRTGRAEAASSVLDEASRHGVESPLLDFLAGKLAAERGDAGAARRSLERALVRGLPPDAAREARALLDAQASRGRDRAPAGPAGGPARPIGGRKP